MRPMDLVVSPPSEICMTMSKKIQENVEENESTPTATKTETKTKTNKNKRKTLVPQRAQTHNHKQSEEMSKIPEDIPESSLLIGEIEAEHNEEITAKLIKGICEGDKTNEKIKLDPTLLNDAQTEWKLQSGIKCNMCEKLFQYKSEFDSHYQSSYKSTPVYTCSFCNKTMEKYTVFRSHCYRHITEGRFKCEDCQRAFSLQSFLQVHILAKHKKIKPYNCNECGKSFVTKAGLKTHARKHQTETKEDYPCVECGKILHTRGGLTSHMNVHRLGRRFMCDVCGKTFTQKVNMLQHVKAHTGDKPYECAKCGKSFTEKSHLSRHVTFHSEERPYKCSVCNKMYKTERCLKVHSMVHGKERPYQCTYCMKGFLSSTKLKQHYNIHTGERPYECKYCERKFTNYPNWLKHNRRRHSNDLKLENSKNKPNVNNAKENEDVFELNIKSEIKDIRDMIDDVPDLLPHLELETAEHIHHDHLTTDFKLSKTDELYLQQNILNFPVAESNSDEFQFVGLPEFYNNDHVSDVPIPSLLQY